MSGSFLSGSTTGSTPCVYVVLACTGYLIGRPIAITSGAEASFGYWFGTVRFIHFVTAFVFFFNFAFRIYWGFVGNKYSHWDNFIPFKKSQWKEMGEVLQGGYPAITMQAIGIGRT